MKNENEKYNRIIAQINDLQPVISNKEKQFAAIMQTVEKTLQKKNHLKPLILVSWSSSVAAAILIGLFLFEYFTMPTNQKYQTSMLPNISTHAVLYRTIEEQPDVTSFNDYLHGKKECQKRIKTLYLSIINKRKIL
jgi:hypothetical protein